MSKIIDDTNGYLNNSEYWNKNLFGFICSLISIDFKKPDKNCLGEYTYYTTDKTKFDSLESACTYQLKLLLRENRNNER